MKKVRVVIVVLAVMIIVGLLALAIDWQQPTSSANLGSWLTIAAQVLLIVAMAVSEWQGRKRQKE